MSGTQGMPIPPDRELRRQAREVASRLADWPVWTQDDGQPTVCPEASTFYASESEDPTIKAKRYAAGAGFLGLAMPYIIEGDGPEARFSEFVTIPPNKSLTPYATYHRNIEATFRRGWQRFVDNADPVQLQRVRNHYNHLLEVDPSTRATGIPISEKFLAKGVELAPELAYFGLMLGIARRKHPKLATSDPDTMRPVVEDVLPTLFRRGRLSLRFVFWGRLLNRDIDYDQIYLTERNNHWRLRSHDNLFAPYDPAKDPEPIGPTIGCMADLVKLRETDKHTAMENATWAGVNALHDANLFDAQTAMDTWQRHQEADRAITPKVERYKIEHASEDQEKVNKKAANMRHDAFENIMH